METKASFTHVTLAWILKKPLWSAKAPRTWRRGSLFNSPVQAIGRNPYSIGPRVGAENSIKDVRWNGPADKAKTVPGSKILAVNGQVFSSDVLRAAIQDAKGKSEPIRLIVQLDNLVSIVDIDYHGGERYPALERVEGTPAYLDDITKPLASPPAAQPKVTTGIDPHPSGWPSSF
jgi:predicted metalloprotease with PDZ domain